MKWRVVLTDTESLTGVAPACESAEHAASAKLNGLEEGQGADTVFDCCPHPHIETWDENFADELATRMTEHEAEICS